MKNRSHKRRENRNRTKMYRDSSLQLEGLESRHLLTATLTVSAVHVERTEGLDPVVEFTFATVPSASVMGPFSIDYTLTGSASPTISNPPSNYFPDYAASASGTLTIPFNNGVPFSKKITIPLVNDTLTEGAETIVINIDPLPGVTISGSGASTTLKDDDQTTVNLSTLTSTFGGDVAATEDDCPFGAINGVNGASCTSDDPRIEISLFTPSSTDTTVELEVDFGSNSATAGTDYVAVPQFVTIPAGATTTGPLAIEILEDATVEIVENIDIRIKQIAAGDVDVSIGSQAVVIPINDGDASTLTLTAPDPVATESPVVGTDDGQFLLSLSKAVDVPITVSYTIGGTATSGTDYVAIPASAIIQTNETTVPLGIQLIDDNIVEGLEDVTLTLTSLAVGGPVSVSTSGVGQVNWTQSQSATVDISDDDVGGNVFLTYQDSSNTTADEENPADTVPLMVGLTLPSSSPTIVRFSVGGNGNISDAEFSNTTPGSAPLPIGHDDYSISGAVPDVTNFPNSTTGRYEYTVTIPANATSALMHVVANDDDIAPGTGVVEGTEFLHIELAPNAAAGYTNSASLSSVDPAIVESDSAQIRLTDHKSSSTKADGFALLSVLETSFAQVTVRVDNAIEGALDVSYQYVSGTATAGADFTDFGSGTYQFANTAAATTNTMLAPGQPLLIQPFDDSLIEGSEEFYIQVVAAHDNGGLTNQPTYAAGDFSTIEIIDDDLLGLNVASAVPESNGSTSVVVPVSVTFNAGAPAGIYTVSTSNGTAVDGGFFIGSDDFDGLFGSATWNGSSFGSNSFGDANNDATLSFSLVVNGDDVVEGNQDFKVTISPPAGANFPVLTESITIIDDDILTVTASNLTAIEGANSGNLSVTTDKAIEGNVSLNVSVNPGTAIIETPAAGIQGDFDPVSPSPIILSGLAGTTSLATVVSTGNSNDTIVEGDETAAIVLSNAVHSNGGLVSPVNGVVTIKDDSEFVAFAVNPTAVAVTEGNTAVVHVTLTGGGGATSSVPITINPVTVDSTATGGSDYTSIANGDQPLNFSGALNQSLSVTIGTNVDGFGEATESLDLTFPTSGISVIPGASITPPATVPISISDGTSTGGGGTGGGSGTVVLINQSNGSTNVSEGGVSDSYTVVLSSNPTSNVQVTVIGSPQINLGNGPGNSTSLVFNQFNGLVPQTINVSAVDDAAPEGVHSVSIGHLVLSGDPTFNLAGVPNVIVNITDNDFPAVVINETGGSTAVTEGGAADTYSIVLGAVPSTSVGITIVPDSQLSIGGGPGVPVAFNFTPANALIPQIVTVTAVDDTVVEGTHSGLLTHTVVSGDPNFNGFQVANIVPVITDNDVSGPTSVPTDILISGSSWATTTTPYRLTNVQSHSGASGHHGRTLPWAHLNTITVNYTGTAPSASSLVLSDPTLATTFVGASGGVATWTVVDPANPLAFVTAGVTNQIGPKDDLTITIGGLSVTTDIVPGDIDASFTTDIGDILAWVSLLATSTSGTAPAFSDVDGSGLTDVGDVNAIILANGAASTPLAAASDRVFADRFTEARSTVRFEKVANEPISRRRVRQSQHRRSINSNAEPSTDAYDSLFASLSDGVDDLSQF